MAGISDRTVGRLIRYHRLLDALAERGVSTVRSHELAQMVGATAAQVRRDLMAVEYSGRPMRGYGVTELMASLHGFLDEEAGKRAALVGVGNLGRAIIAYLSGRRPGLSIEATFDTDPAKFGASSDERVCFPLSQLAPVVRERRINVGIITVPAAAAQSVGQALADAGVRGIVNFAPVSLHVAPDVHVEYIDMTISLEKAAFFASHAHTQHGTGPH